MTLNQEVKAIVALDIPWEDRYSMVFSEKRSRAVFALFKELGARFDYYDPDAGYSDDVLAFADALDRRLAELGPLLEKLAPEPFARLGRKRAP